ncbi:M1 aminopeptidase family protein [Kordiimonas aestuarii]|uniref:hypothetical protein n=1 Tax=Kordiimonas aestuarii TaxID=1005925 RepID=UPI0021D239FD|nr:hypothetical protein [Kordiimonas aestuarii]
MIGIIRQPVLVGISLIMTATQAHASDTSHYDVNAHLSPDGKLNATVTITLTPEDAKRDLDFVLAKRFKITKLEVDDAATYKIGVAETPLPDLQLIETDFPDSQSEFATLTFTYEGPLDEPDSKAPAYGPDGLELALDYMWFPLAQQINLNFSAHTVLSGLPEELVVAAQGEVERKGDTVTITRQSPDFDIPLVAAPGLSKRSSGHVDVYAPDFDYPPVENITDHAAKSAAYFEDIFGPAGYQGRIVLSVLPRERNAYARRGYVVMSEARSAIEKDPNVPAWAFARIVAHEFSHAWWMYADPMSDDFWMTESLAEYSAMRYLARGFGSAVADDLMEKRYQTALDAGPILGGGRPSSSSLYRRGPMILNELEGRIGRDTMDKVLRVVAEEQLGTTDEFLTVLEGHTEASIAAWFKAMLKTGPGPWLPEDAANTAQGSR